MGVQLHATGDTSDGLAGAGTIARPALADGTSGDHRNPYVPRLSLELPARLSGV